MCLIINSFFQVRNLYNGLGIKKIFLKKRHKIWDSYYKNFKYIRRYPTLASNWCESFSVDALYEFQAHEPALNDEDWKNLTRAGKLIKIKRNNVLLQQGKLCEFLFYIIKGTFRVTIKSHKDSLKDSMKDPLNSFELEPKESEQNSLYSVNSITHSKQTIPILPTQQLNDSHLISKPIVHSPRKTPPSPTNRTLEKKK